MAGVLLGIARSVLNSHAKSVVPALGPWLSLLECSAQYFVRVLLPADLGRENEVRILYEAFTHL